MKTNHMLLSALLLCATGCTSEMTDEPATDLQDKYPVSFTGGISMVQTKTDPGTADMGKENKAMIYAYATGADVTTATAKASGEYTAGDNGNLTATKTMYLAKDSYDFYAVSTNSTTTAPTFTNGETNALNNGVDYLWVKEDNKAIASTPATSQNVALTFVRKAVKIHLNIESGDGIELAGWQTSSPAQITPPDPSTTCKMTLSTGAIVAATTLLSTPAEMTKTEVSEKRATVSYIMLPLGSNQTPKVTLKVKVKVGTQITEDERTYEATLGYPTGGFQSGNQYTYKATLKANGITFTGAKVTDWTDNTQADLTPTEPDSN